MKNKNITLEEFINLAFDVAKVIDYNKESSKIRESALEIFDEINDDRAENNKELLTYTESKAILKECFELDAEIEQGIY